MFSTHQIEQQPSQPPHPQPPLWRRQERRATTSQIPRRARIRNSSMARPPLCQKQRRVVYQEGDHPGHGTLADGHACGLPTGAQLPFYRGDCCYTGRIQQGGDQEAQGTDGGEQGAQSLHRDLGTSTGEDAQGGNDGLLGDEAGDEGRGDPPVTEAQGLNSGARTAPTVASRLSALSLTRFSRVSKA